ncbi:MAG: hypothetical protein WBF02_17340, partial [Xanthobacteraceae bacterium]
MGLIDFPMLTSGRRESISSASLLCDHCREKIGTRAHDYWHMRFCSSACTSAYKQRLSPQTKQKILLL